MGQFWLFFCPTKAKKRLKSTNIFFAAFCSVGKHLHTKFQKISLKSLDFGNFLHFGLFWLFLGQKMVKKGWNWKLIFLQHFLLLGRIYIINFRKFHQTIWILPIFFIFGQFWLFFLPKKDQKMTKSKENIFVAFSFVEKHLLTKFQKISSNGSQDNLWRTDARTNKRTEVNL